MRKLMLIGVLCLIAICPVGCCSKKAPVTTAIQTGHKAPETADPKGIYIADNHDKTVTLPTGATNITHIGGGWLTFELEMKGRKRTFMYARSRTSHGNLVSTITEISE